MRSKKSAPATAGTDRRSKGLGGNPSAYLTTRGSARSSVVAGGMTPVLLRAAAGALFAAFVGWAASFHPASEALADGGETWEPETVRMEVMGPSAQPAPIPAPGPLEITINEGDAEILARLLWSSPLTNESRKRELCWLVFNRVDDERLGLFGASVESVVIRKEFTFFDSKAHVSETNLRIAREELRRWALYLLGAVKERLLPGEYVFAAFEGHSVRFYAEIGGNPFPGGESIRTAGETTLPDESDHGSGDALTEQE